MESREHLVVETKIGSAIQSRGAVPDSHENVNPLRFPGSNWLVGADLMLSCDCGILLSIVP